MNVRSISVASTPELGPYTSLANILSHFTVGATENNRVTESTITISQIGNIN